jgi:hypothetical protein
MRQVVPLLVIGWPIRIWKVGMWEDWEEGLFVPPSPSLTHAKQYTEFICVLFTHYLHVVYSPFIFIFSLKFTCLKSNICEP